MEAIASFLSLGDAYCSNSFGKQGTIVAHLCNQLSVPIVWVRVEPVKNPDCLLVRDASCFGNYIEQVVDCCLDENGLAKSSGTLESGFKLVENLLKTRRRITGICAYESRDRKIRDLVYGENSKNTSAPISKWKNEDVFAYLQWKGLPIHPAYAMTDAGGFDRLQLRVSSLGGRRGTWAGRRDWEKLYYPDVVRLAN